MSRIYIDKRRTRDQLKVYDLDGRLIGKSIVYIDPEEGTMLGLFLHSFMKDMPHYKSHYPRQTHGKYVMIWLRYKGVLIEGLTRVLTLAEWHRFIEGPASERSHESQSDSQGNVQGSRRPRRGTAVPV